ncbi:MAG: alpha/beta fold hydrolase [Planctomycetota bacterium]|jgi:esterase/lipase/1-acyl-sn-glycerol-3-phosphate acyltransferase
MALRTYKVTGACITALTRLLRMKLRVTGAEHVPARPTIFAVNHFTRSETVLVPYAIYHHLGRPVRSLATHVVFRGLMARWLRACGVMSTRDPRRNRTIVAQLMTGDRDWVIYPEGGLVKNKKTMRGGRLHLTRPRRKGPPHTGAAMLALKAEICKRRYRRACAANDRERMAFYERTYGLSGPGDLAEESAVIVPVSITYHPMRSGRNPLSRIGRLLSPGLDPRVAEELLVEGTILFSAPEVSLHFNEPVEVTSFIDRTTELARRVFGLVSEDRRTELFLRRQARRLTATSMRSVYRGTEVNFDHLFCYGLRALRGETVERERFHRALYLAALELRRRDDVRLHHVLDNGISSLLTGDTFPPLRSALRLARREGVLRVDNGRYAVDREALGADHGFHEVRLHKMVQVIANELEPVEPATRVLDRAVNLDDARLGRRLADSARAADLAAFEREHRRCADAGGVPSARIGAPFMLEAPGARTGVVLTHGYLSCPEQMRPLAEHLHAAGCTVYVTRLAGHGVSPRRLRAVSWHDWMDSVMQGYVVIRNTCERVVAGGFSLGGALTLLLGSRRPDVDAVFTVNAPMRLRDVRAPLASVLVSAAYALERVGVRGPSLRRLNRRREDTGLSYEWDTLHSVHEVRLAVAACRRELHRVAAPVLALQSDDDPTVCPTSGRRLLQQLPGARARLLHVRTDRHHIIRGEGSEPVFRHVAGFVAPRT